jgi:hypothetical protein
MATSSRFCRARQSSTLVRAADTHCANSGAKQGLRKSGLIACNSRQQRVVLSSNSRPEINSNRRLCVRDAWLRGRERFGSDLSVVSVSTTKDESRTFEITPKLASRERRGKVGDSPAFKFLLLLLLELHKSLDSLHSSDFQFQASCPHRMQIEPPPPEAARPVRATKDENGLFVIADHSAGSAAVAAGPASWLPLRYSGRRLRCRRRSPKSLTRSSRSDR